MPADLEQSADEAAQRMASLDQRGTDALGTMNTILDEMEAGVSATEDAINQLTNGGPTI